MEDRIQSCHAKLIVTIDSYNAQRPVEVVQNVRNKCHSIQQIVCVFRKEPTSLVFDQCASFAKVSKNGAKECPMVWMQAQDPLLILFHNKVSFFISCLLYSFHMCTTLAFLSTESLILQRFNPKWIILVFGLPLTRHG